MLEHEHLYLIWWIDEMDPLFYFYSTMDMYTLSFEKLFCSVLHHHY